MRNVFWYCLAIGIALCLLPVIALCALCVYAYDRHNPFYVSQRIGKDGRPFTLIKLRSMRMDPGNCHRDSTASNDPRITPIGAFIRKFKIDEFTQIINVIKGDMLFVGPRPQVPIEVQRYTNVERGILAVKPGITDIASIVFADEAELLSGSDNPDLLYAQIERPWKSRLALLYIQHASFKLDVQLAVLTFINSFARPWVLRRLSAIVSDWPMDPPDLLEIVGRTKAPYAYPVPGKDEVIQAL